MHSKIWLQLYVTNSYYYVKHGFRFPDLSGSKSLLDGEAIQTLVCTATESSIGDVGDTEETIQVDVNSTCNGVALSLANSEHSTSKDNPQAPGWTKRYTSVNACFYFEHMPTLTGMYVPSKNTKV
ncbi:hypothetical protein VPH35_065325 [Triticum aestivum]